MLAAVSGAWTLLRPRSGGPWFLAVIVIAAFLLFYGYFAGFEAFWHGQTPGKRLIGLRVLSVTGRPARIDEAILRNLLRVIDQLPGVYAIGIVTMLVSSRNQRLGDLAAGTVVVHEKALSAPVMTVATPAAGVAWTGGGLTEAELLLVETFLQRRHEIEPADPRDARPRHRRAAARPPRRLGARARCRSADRSAARAGPHDRPRALNNAARVTARRRPTRQPSGESGCGRCR